jgi:hypothetical protein
MQKSLEQLFHERAENLYWEALYASRQVGEEYLANRYLAGVRNHGGVKFAKLCMSREQQSGMDRLQSLGLTHLSLEQMMVKPPYRDLFSQAELAEAERRLAVPAHVTA